MIGIIFQAPLRFKASPRGALYIFIMQVYDYKIFWNIFIEEKSVPKFPTGIRYL